MPFCETTSTELRTIPVAVQRGLLRIPPLSPAATRLYRLSGEKADLREIASLIRTDPALSAAVLRLVNSPLFGVWQPVRGILQAVALLGLRRLRALATTAALRMLVRPEMASPALTRCWRHSVACALITQDTAASSGSDGDAAYTAGLLHDMGCFAMLSCWPKEYSQILATCLPADELQVEFESLGVSHPDAGAFLLERWDLPAELVVVAREHHSRSGGRSTLVDMVSRSCRTADSLGFALTAKAAFDNAPDHSLESLIPGQNTSWLRVADGINQLDCV